MAFGIATILTTLGKAQTTSRLVSSALAVPGYIAIGVGATGAARTAAVGDTVLSTEVLRQAATLTQVLTSTTNDTYQAVSTFLASSAWAVDEIGIFDNVSGGNMYLSSTQAVNNLAIGDSIQITARVQYS